ncbi:Wzz/FepE/Etk N-terminal domain-containing protein [Marinoscillum pacificum]|uniref:Wzz/FepE/Etk N-terminal domain-containing protein n=1 Tax=Marinoscillum pacificum TaxID=392723 RepID=UPI002157EB22|nr:Wzz/FepE/Etk N-terminal domain-containing protein [Marinoscillum pacificum]
MSEPKVSDEIDLIEVFHGVWKKRYTVIKVGIAGAIIGLLVALSLPVEYEASCRLIPENQGSSMGGMNGLSGLASLAGIDLSSNNGKSLSPTLYAEIVGSTPFIIEIINDTLYFSNDDVKLTPKKYFEEIYSPSISSYFLQYTIGLPGLIKSMFMQPKTDKLIEENSNVFSLSKSDKKLIKSMRERILLNIDERTGLIQIMVEMPDPYAAAQLANNVKVKITESVVGYKTSKAHMNLDFIEGAYLNAKEKFTALKNKLAIVSDRNLNISSASARIEIENVQMEYNSAYQIYTSLGTQLEQAKIHLNEETPVFTMLEPVLIPTEKSSPKRLLIVLVFGILGTVIGVLIALFKFQMG